MFILVLLKGKGKWFGSDRIGLDLGYYVFSLRCGSRTAAMHAFQRISEYLTVVC